MDEKLAAEHGMWWEGEAVECPDRQSNVSVWRRGRRHEFAHQVEGLSGRQPRQFVQVS